jgi:nicotinate-nucleotide adenylyltransferase
LIGADAARDLPGWREAEAIPTLSRVVVLTRPGVSPPSDTAAAEMLEVPRVEVSATEIRARVRRGEPIRELVPAEVADYIEARGLYRTGD